MGRPKTVAALHKRQLGGCRLVRLKDKDLLGWTLWRVKYFIRVSVGKNLCHVIGSLIHRVPKVVVPIGRADFDERARHSVFIQLAGKSYLAGRVTGSHLADAPDGDNDVV